MAKMACPDFRALQVWMEHPANLASTEKMASLVLPELQAHQA